MTSQLSDIRAAVARACDDWVESTASVNSSDGTTWIDEYALYENDSHFRRSEVWFVTGPNVGTKKRVADSALSSTSMTFSGSVGNVPQAGDKLWIFNIGGSGTRINEYDAQIRDSVSSLGRAAFPLYQDDVVGLWDNRILWVDIPAAFKSVHGVSYQDYNGNRIIVPDHGFEVDFIRRKIALEPEYADVASGYTVHIDGRKAPTPLTLDSDTTDIDFEWLYKESAAQILMRQRDQMLVTKGGMMKNEADGLRGNAYPFGLVGNTVWLV